MNEAWKKPAINIRPGTVVTGKWHQRRYVIKRKLGHGTVGTVFLCEWNGQYAALKMSENSTSMTMEVNVLKSLEKVQGSRLGPSLLDVDDWKTSHGVTYSYYVMEYLQGESLDQFIKRQGDEWLGVLMLQLLSDLEELHRAGWVLGDFKPDNLIVLSSPPKVRWIDVGGTTQIGRAIKEYTEFFDRGYWGMGSRRAEPSYDLFAFVMVFLTIYYPGRFDRGANPKATLLKKLDDVKALRMYRQCLKRALLGGYQSSTPMRKDLLNIIHAAGTHHKNKPRQGRRRSASYAVNGAPFAEGSGIVVIALIYYLSSLLLP